jgi:hypothetical protein
MKQPNTSQATAVSPYLATMIEDRPVIPLINAAEATHAAQCIERCTRAAADAQARATAQGLTNREARSRAIMAWKLNLPLMDSYENVIAAIACITAGIHADFISGSDAGKHLYAAQVALSALREAGRA